MPLVVNEASDVNEAGCDDDEGDDDWPSVPSNPPSAETSDGDEPGEGEGSPTTRTRHNCPGTTDP
jgi:hypothetical protein